MKTRYLTILATLAFVIGLLSMPATAYAHHCKGGHANDTGCDPGGGGKDVATYSVVITQEVMAQSVWEQGSGRKSISYGANFSADFFTSLGVIVFGGDDSFTAEQGALCFPVDLFPIRLFAGTIKPHKGGAVADFWFGANTFVGDLPVKYRLRLGGDFDPVEAWLPVSGGHTHLMMTDWELFTVNEPQEIDEISCLGVGTANVIIEVTGL